MNISYTEDKSFLGRVLYLSNGKIELGVSLDVGPRIISLKKVGGENIMFEDVGDNVNNDCSSVYGAGKKWHIYGGHRIWLSPEDNSTYYPDNTPVSYQKTPNGAKFIPDAWKVVEVQPMVEIAFKEDGDVDILMSFTNVSNRTKKLCLWALTVLKSGAHLEIPLSTENTGFLANRNLVLWSYTDIYDPRLKIENDKAIVNSSITATKPLKLGTYMKDISVKYVYGDTTLIKTIYNSVGEFPDYCCNVETYTSNFIHEVETLSPIQNTAPGEAITHLEHWSIR